MKDESDDVIGAAVGEFHAYRATRPGTTTVAVRAIVARRRRSRIASLCVLGAVVVAVPIAASAMGSRGDKQPLGLPTESSVTPPNVVDGRIAISQLVAAGVEAGFDDAYRCDERVDAKSSTPQNGDVYVSRIEYANLDADAPMEAVVELHCHGPANVAWRLLAFDRNPAGQIVQLGQIAGGLSDIVSLKEFSGRPNGRLSFVITKWDAMGFPVADQTREFRWNGSKFVQVGGPTKF